MSDKTVNELEREMKVAVDLKKAKELAASLTVAACMMAMKHGPGPVIAAMSIALGELAAVMKPDEEDEKDWYAQICNLVAKSYLLEARKKEG